jgi:hypothetical protein
MDLSVPPGDWYVIAEDDPDGTVGSGDEAYVGKVINDLESNQTKKRTLRFFEMVKGKSTKKEKSKKKKK